MTNPDDKPKRATFADLGRLVHGDRWDAVDHERRTEAVRTARRERADHVMKRVVDVTMTAALILLLAAAVVGAWRWAL